MKRLSSSNFYHVKNLCLMNNEKHELFHSWLVWKRGKSGRYPSYKQQRRVLEREYGGRLLESITPSFLGNDTEEDFYEEVSKRFSNKNNLSDKLMIELKKERKILAKENKLPAYYIFHDSTLIEMSQSMPTSTQMMLKVKGVGPEKMRLYGDRFIQIIKDFKSKAENESA